MSNGNIEAVKGLTNYLSTNEKAARDLAIQVVVESNFGPTDNNWLVNYRALIAAGRLPMLEEIQTELRQILHDRDRKS